MPIVRTCCSRELAGSCIHCCDNRYCTNTDQIIYDWLDGFCTGYINKEVFKCSEDVEYGNNESL